MQIAADEQPRGAETADATAGVMSAALALHHATLAAYVDRHLPAVLRASVDPTDVLQDVWCEAMRTAAGYRPDAESGGRRWLLTIARRRMLHLLRRQRASRQSTAATFGADADDPVVQLLEELAVYRRTPSQSAASHETWLHVHAAIGRLPPDYSSVLRARYLDGLPAREVAACTGRTPAAIDKLCSRAVAALRVALGACYA